MSERTKAKAVKVIRLYSSLFPMTWSKMEKIGAVLGWPGGTTGH